MSYNDLSFGDAEIRAALRTELRNQHRSEPETVLVEELGLCRGHVRVDIAVVNGILHGYEIKSERDTLRRLLVQTEYYSKVLEYATLVAGDRHINEAMARVPLWWGITRVESAAGGPIFHTERPGHKNPERDARSLVELIWLEDAVEMLEKRGAARGVRGKPRRLVWDRVCDHFSLDEIAEVVRRHLKLRKGNSNRA